MSYSINNFVKSDLTLNILSGSNNFLYWILHKVSLLAASGGGCVVSVGGVGGLGL
jgi:hypothetical protein